MNNNTKLDFFWEWGIYEGQWGRNLEEVQVFVYVKKSLYKKQLHFV